MIKRLKIIIVIIIFSAGLSCFDDSGQDVPKGTLKVTVKTSADIWGYPKLKSGSTTDYEAYSGDVSYTWHYPETGGDVVSADPETDLSDQRIPFPDSILGDKENYVYLYGSLGDASGLTPVLYNGKSSINDTVITITDVAAGEYYVVAFYDYKTGGKRTNLLNRYDRYAIYTETPYDTTANSTPFADKASSIIISENQTTEITLEIKRDWLLGKPKTTDGGTGRIFLKSTDFDPVRVPVP